MKTDASKDPNRIFFEESHLIDEALRKGVHDAILTHKQQGHRVVIERDGKIVWISAEELLAE